MSAGKTNEFEREAGIEAPTPPAGAVEPTPRHEGLRRAVRTQSYAQGAAMLSPRGAAGPSSAGRRGNVPARDRWQQGRTMTPGAALPLRIQQSHIDQALLSGLAPELPLQHFLGQLVGRGQDELAQRIAAGHGLQLAPFLNGDRIPLAPSDRERILGTRAGVGRSASSQASATPTLHGLGPAHLASTASRNPTLTGIGAAHEPITASRSPTLHGQGPAHEPATASRTATLPGIAPAHAWSVRSRAPTLTGLGPCASAGNAAQSVPAGGQPEAGVRASRVSRPVGIHGPQEMLIPLVRNLVATGHPDEARRVAASHGFALEPIVHSGALVPHAPEPGEAPVVPTTGVGPGTDAQAVHGMMSLARGGSAVQTLGAGRAPGTSDVDYQAAQGTAVSDLAGAAHDAATLGGGSGGMQQALGAGQGLANVGAGFLQGRAALDQLRGGREAEGLENAAGAGQNLTSGAGTVAENLGATGVGQVLNNASRAFDVAGGTLAMGRGVDRIRHGDAEGGSLDTLDGALRTGGALAGPAGTAVTGLARAGLSLGRAGDEEVRRQGLHRVRMAGRGVHGASTVRNDSSSDHAAREADRVRRQHGQLAGAGALVGYTGVATVEAGVAGTVATINSAANFGSDASDLEARDRFERGETAPPATTDTAQPEHERRVRAAMRRLAAQAEHDRPAARGPMTQAEIEAAANGPVTML